MEPVLLMSIKTKYAKQIFQGIKKYEFRRKSIGEKNCNKKIYIYSSKDDKAIIGYIIIDKILSGDINFVLKNTNSLNNQEIKNYFNNCSKCYALHVSKFYKFSKPLNLKEIRNNYERCAIPQFYRYIKTTDPIYTELKKREKRTDLINFYMK